MKTKLSVGALLVFVVMTGVGCVHVISKEVRNQVGFVVWSLGVPLPLAALGREFSGCVSR
jgi:hypothetical protein